MSGTRRPHVKTCNRRLSRLQVVEFSIVKKMKKDSEHHGSELSEMSIFRSQQMDKVRAR